MFKVTAMTNADGDLLTAYADHQRMRGLSPKTIKRRRTSIGIFLAFVRPLSVNDVDGSLVEEWLGLIPVASTRKAYRADLSAFFRWAARRKLVTENPILEVEAVRVAQGLPRPIDSSLIADLVRFAPDRETQLAVALGAYAGLRCFEVAALTREDLSLDTKPPVVVVRNGKGGRDRVIPCHPYLAEVLRGVGPGRLCQHKTDTIGRKVSRYLRDSGTDATMHQLRHTFGTEAAAVSRDLLVVSELMGHASPTTTVRYTKLAGFRTADTVATMYGAAG